MLSLFSVPSKGFIYIANRDFFSFTLMTRTFYVFIMTPLSVGDFDSFLKRYPLKSSHTSSKAFLK